jgi:hypothetical protein
LVDLDGRYLKFIVSSYKESVITGSLGAPDLMLSQVFELADFLVFWQDKKIKIRLELVRMRTNSLFF